MVREVMKLTEAYERLGLCPPLDFEQEVYDSSLFRKELSRKRIGSTTHMLIEAVLDYAGFQIRGIQKFWRIVLSMDRNEELKTRKFLERACNDLGIVKDESWFLLCERRFGEPVFEDYGMWKANMVYVDHDLLNPESRLTGPYRLIRSAQELSDGTYECFSRDNDLVARISSKEEMNKVLVHTMCPVYVQKLDESRLHVGGRFYDA